MSQVNLPELNIIQQIADVTSDLTPAERRRVAAWFVEYARQAGEGNETDGELDAVPGADEVPEDVAERPLNTFAALYEAVAPKRGAQKAAVAGWWLQTREGQDSWKAFDVNKLLKGIGVKVSSMSIVLTNAVKATDPIIVELGRLGEGDRSRKTFRLSDAGMAYVEARLG